MTLQKPLKRRDFLKGTAVASLVVGGAGLTGCSSSKSDDLAATGSTEGMNAHAVASDAAALEEGAQWVTAACWHNCGGRCLNKALVKDGVVIHSQSKFSFYLFSL